MPTVLLQAILDLLKGFVETWGNFAQYILDVLADIFEKLGLLEEIGDDVTAIKDNTQDIQADVGVIKTNTTNANSYLSNIQTNTGSIVTPITGIKTDADLIATKVTSIDTHTTAISNNMSGIASSASAAAAFDEDIANNTLNTYNKVVTMASDTTQLRADMVTIIGLLQDIKNLM